MNFCKESRNRTRGNTITSILLIIIKVLVETRVSLCCSEKWFGIRPLATLSSLFLLPPFPSHPLLNCSEGWTWVSNVISKKMRMVKKMIRLAAKRRDQIQWSSAQRRKQTLLQLVERQRHHNAGKNCIEKECWDSAGSSTVSHPEECS